MIESQSQTLSISGRHGNRFRAMSAVLLLALMFNSAGAQSQNSLQWALTPYLWLPTTKVDLTLGDTSVGGEIDFRDVIDSIDAAFMGTAEVGMGNWSGFVDLTYIDASDVSERTLVTVRAENTIHFIDAGVAWWPGGIDGPLNVFGGIRYTGFDDRYRFTGNANGNTLLDSQSNADYVDALIGLRYRFDLSDRWSIRTRADASFGDSEGTWLARASLAYAVGQRQQNLVLVGYQFKGAEYVDDGLVQDFLFDGLTAGFAFLF